MTDAGSLFQACVEYRDAVQAAVATAPGGPIARAYVSPGPPAWDCCQPGQICVWTLGPEQAASSPSSPVLAPGQRDEIGVALNVVTLVAQVIRCVPTLGKGGQIPSVASLETAAEVVIGDVWAVWNHVKTLWRAGTLFPRSGARARSLFFEPTVPNDPAGGCGGFDITVRVTLDGYRT